VVDVEDVIRTIKFYNVLINNYLYSISPLPQDPSKVVVEGCKNVLKKSRATLAYKTNKTSLH
jgi:hypothetical protein